ncbi:MAG TPA: SpoIIE family protein phosphatase [Gemmatales bacterium]|nr:SpoIIE family protein phosphatase [Gemmatales bacterium]
MAAVVLLSDFAPPTAYPINGREFVFGRQADADLQLNAREVSRRHARLLREGAQWFLEDLGSSNGTYVNSERVAGRLRVHELDQIQIGPFMMQFNETTPILPQQDDVVIRAAEIVQTSNTNLFRLDAPRKLQVVLEIAEQLACSLDAEVLISKLLENLLNLFTQADRVIVVRVDGPEPRIRAVRTRNPDSLVPPSFSRTVVRRVVAEGIGIVAEDASADQRFDSTKTLSNLGIRSFVCVPLKWRDGQTLGVVILDRFGGGNPFTADDLHLLTAIVLQATVALENAALHAEALRKARLAQDIIVAQQIQEGFLPSELPPTAQARLDFFAQVYPAREMAGDFYDFFAVGEDRLAFAVADISGKGIPAALFMSGIRCLTRYLLQEMAYSPAQVLQAVNETLAVDNPKVMFVTMALGLIEVDTGAVVLASAGHPPTLIRRAAGAVEQVKHPIVRLLGIAKGRLPLVDTKLELGPGDTLVLYTDGLTETKEDGRETMIGQEGLTRIMSELPPGQSVQQWGESLKTATDRFRGTTPAHDDITLLLLRRR